MPTRNFFELTTDNASECNLTELNAAETVDSGFVSHNDWLSHVNRYAYVMKRLLKSDTSSLLDVGCGRMQLPYFLWKNRARPQNQEFAYRWQLGWTKKESEQFVDTKLKTEVYGTVRSKISKISGNICFRTRSTVDARGMANGHEVDILISKYPNLLQ